MVPAFSASLSAELTLASATANAAIGAQQPPDPFSNPNGPFANLDLTADQQNQIDSILSTAKSQGLSFSQINSQIEQVLNPAQQQTFQSDLQQMQAHRGGDHHHHHGGGSSSSGSSQGLLGQLDLSGDQQNQITSTGTYSSTGNSTSSSLPYLVNTNA
jgi:Spy/CpxP family protein refolding chaperone